MTQQWLLDLLWNSLRKMPRGTEVQSDGLAITVERRGISSEIALGHLSCLQLYVWSAVEHTGKDTALWSVGLRGQTLKIIVTKCALGPHTSSHPNYPWGTPGTNNWEGPISQFPLDTEENFSMFTEGPSPLSSQATTAMGLSGRVMCYYFSHPLSCSWDSLLFSHTFLIVKSPSPLLGRNILNKVQASVFMNMELALSLPLVEQSVNLKVWADGKTVCWAQNAVPVFIKLKDPPPFPHQK